MARGMITIVVPTRNRSYTLRRVAASYYRQESVTEIVFVSDCGSDDTPAVVAAIAAGFPQIRTVMLKNEQQSGAAFSRNVGARAATNPYILFCDDDEFLESGYAKVCLEKLLATGVAAVSGRRVIKLPQESPEEAVHRFADGLTNAKPFGRIVCEFNPEARFTGDRKMPLTNSVLLTTKALIEQYGFDSHYRRGSCFREESDFQMNLFTSGHDILVTNDVHSIHLHRTECTQGGARRSRFSRYYWAVRYNRYFYKKYYDRYAARVGLRLPRQAADALFALYQVYFLFIKPVVRFALNRPGARILARPQSA
jgi:glycosyltransferase involved in cell wall biosynthesis